MDDLYTVVQAAKILHLSPNTFRAYINDGLIRVVRTGRKRGTWIRSSDLEKFMDYLTEQNKTASCA